MNTGKDIVAESARQGQKDDQDAAQDTCLPAADVVKVHRHRHNVFKHSQNRRKSCKCHENKEQGTPYPSCRHVIKNVRQRDENQ